MATEVAILAAVCPTKLTIPAAISCLDISVSIFDIFPKLTAVVSVGSSPIGPETTSSKIKSTPDSFPAFANSAILSGSVVPHNNLERPKTVPPPTPVPEQ